MSEAAEPEESEDTGWRDASQLFPADGWRCSRAVTATEEGVTTFVHLTLLDSETGRTLEVALVLGVASEVGYDLMGAAHDYAGYEG